MRAPRGPLTGHHRSTEPTFNFKSNSIRVVEIDGEPWFVAKDVCDALGLGNTTQAISILIQNEVRNAVVREGRARPNKVITESGLYKLIMRSDKPEARKGLALVTEGENKTMEGWLLYGAALNEGREMFPGDREFGEWLRNSNLEEGLHPADQAAALWAAANPQDFLATKKANPRVRTVRGLHAKYV